MAGGLLAGKNQVLCSVKGGLVSSPHFAPFTRTPGARGAVGAGNILSSSEVHVRLCYPLPCHTLCPSLPTLGDCEREQGDCHAPGCQLTVVGVQLLLWL